MAERIEMSLIAALVLLGAVAMVTGQNENCNKIVSSNVGLTASIGTVEKRTTLVANEYAKLDADVVCSQEFWHEEQLIEVLEKTDFPYHYSPIHHTISELADPSDRWWHFWKKRGACSWDETTYLTLFLVQCATVNGCITSNLNQVAVCLSTKCAAVLKSSRVSADCVGCIFQNMASSIGDSFEKCHYYHAGHRFNAPGLALFSKKRITSARYVNFFPDNRQMLQRGYIEAKIADLGTVVCAHLSSNVGGYFEYDLPYGSYKAQQRVEIQHINKTFSGQDHIFAGDLNTGPMVNDTADPEKNLAPEFQENYDLLLNLGYASPYMAQVGKCTYCKNNPLVDGNLYPNFDLDHVLFRGARYDVREAERIMDFTTPWPMSDHYGVQVKFCIAPIP